MRTVLHTITYHRRKCSLRFVRQKIDDSDSENWRVAMLFKFFNGEKRVWGEQKSVLRVKPLFGHKALN